MPITFLHAADIHLDSPLRGLERYEGAPVERIRGASRRAVDRLIDLAIFPTETGAITTPGSILPAGLVV